MEFDGKACRSRTFAEIRNEAGVSFIAEDQLSFITQVGEGTFAVVDQARLKNHARGSRVVAIKRLRSMLIESDRELSDFMQEGALLKRLNHPCIVDSVGLGFNPSKNLAEPVDPESMYIVQEFMTGGSLKLKVLQQMMTPDEVVYSSWEAVKWCIQIAEGLAYLHAQRPLVIHRDLKLENCLLTDDGEGGLDCKVADFGLHAVLQAVDEDESVQKLKQRATSCAAPEEATGRLDSLLAVQAPSPSFRSAASQSSLPPSALSLRRKLSQRASSIGGTALRKPQKSSGSVRGPPRYEMTGKAGSYLYMAPEVMLNEAYNEKVDIFSLGIIIFEVFARSVSGVVLLQSGDEDECEMFAWKVAQGYRRPVPAWWPPALLLLICSCWAPDPDLRPAAAEVLQRLKQLQASNDIKYLDNPDGVERTFCCVQ